MKNIVSFIVGALFATGLVIGGMVKVQVVKGFLDIFGQWNFDLILLMISSVLVHTVLFQLIKKRPTPLLDTKFHLPTRKDIDKKLLIGAAIFGLGWGWGGICPGPGIVNLVTGRVESILFVISMIVGMLLYKNLEKLQQQKVKK